MVRRSEPDPADRDERLGEAIEAYLTLAESGPVPDPEAFAAGYPGLEADLLAALEGLALVQGLVGQPGSARARGPAPGWRPAGGSPATGSSASWAAGAWGSSTRRSTSTSTAPSR